MRLLTTDNLKQIGLISIIVVMGLSILNKFSDYIPGTLGAITMYMVLRQPYLKLVEQRNWKKWVAATVFIILGIIVFVLPAFFIFQAILPKLNAALSQTDKLQDLIKSFTQSLNGHGLPINFDAKQLTGLLKEVSSSIPMLLGATANLLTNTVLAFFFLYFMLVQGKEMEAAIHRFLPLQENNVDDIWDGTKLVVFANAIGIPVLAACQAVVAILGYWIFGVESYIFLGVMTGVFSVVPIVGTAIIWVPVCAYLAVSGNTGAAVGLAIYSLVITGGIDNVLRFTILKKLGDVHPVVTTIGIIIGIPMFGFMGFIFGPLLVSYLLLLIKIYRVEFASKSQKLKKS